MQVWCEYNAIYKNFDNSRRNIYYYIYPYTGLKRLHVQTRGEKKMYFPIFFYFFTALKI